MIDMRLRRRQQDPPPGPDLQQQEVAVFLAEAQRLLDHHWRRGDSFERKAVGVLTYVAVIIALLPPAVPVVLALSGSYRVVALALGGAAILFLGFSVITALGVLHTRRSQGANIAHVRNNWRDTCARLDAPWTASDAYYATQAQRDLTEMLLHGTSDATSPVRSMAEDADRRGTWFAWCVRSNVLGLLSILALTVVTALGRL